MRMVRQARAPVLKPSRYDGDENRRVVLEAALRVFSEVGFAAASTRAIAAAAGIEQGHLAYYFPTKLSLWQKVVEAFARTGEVHLQHQLAGDALGDPVATAWRILPGFLRTFADEPRLTRLMLQEFSVNSERQKWLVEAFGTPVWELIAPLFTALSLKGYLGGSRPEIAYFSLIGAALVTFGNGDLIRTMSGADPADTYWIEAAIAHMIAPVVMVAPVA